MKESKAAFVLMGVCIFISNVAYGTLVEFNDSQTNTTFTITTTNMTDIIWTGYILALDEQDNVTFVEGSASSTDFETALYPDPRTIEFTAPQVMPPGEVVTFEFKVTIPDSGLYTIALTQEPIPEPATAVLLGLGALALLMRRA